MSHPSVDLAPGSEFICTECGEGFDQYQKLISHMTTHGPIGPFSSNPEGGSNGCDTPIEFALHENGTLTVVDKSALSNFSFLFGKPSLRPLLNQEGILDPTLSSKLAEKEHHCKCDRCGQLFKSQHSLQQHQRYRPLEQGFKCTLCCKVFYDREGLHEHLQNHAHERFYSCGHCGKRFLRQETLASHQKEKHGPLASKVSVRLEEECENSLERSYPCKVCGLHFFWLSDLQTHLISHSHAKKSTVHTPQKENIQDKDVGGESKNGSYATGGHFASLTQLKEHHLSKHRDEKSSEDSSEDLENTLPKRVKRNPLKYYGVMRNVISKNQLQRLDPFRPRIRGRPKEVSARSPNSKLFPCKYCHRVFVHSSSLSRHMRYHKGTLHTCSYCGRHFPQRCDVTRHIAMYHAAEIRTKGDRNGDPLTHESSEMLLSNHGDDESPEDEDMLSPMPSDPEESQAAADVPEVPLHKARVSYTCKDCGRIFKLLGVYHRHIRYHQKNRPGLLLSCPRCPSRFSIRSALERHLENHDKEGTIKGAQAETEQLIEPVSLEDDDDDDDDVEKDEEPSAKKRALDLGSKESKTADVLYDCTECTETFSDLQLFLKHQSAHS